MARQVSSGFMNSNGAQVRDEPSKPYDAAVASPVGEAEVAFIVAKMFMSAEHKHGFPAFSAAHKLLGYFRPRAQGLEFVPLANAMAAGHLSAPTIEGAAASLNRQISVGSHSVFRLESFPAGGLVEMKAKAHAYFQSKYRPTGEQAGGVGSGGASDIFDDFGALADIDPDLFFEMEI